MKKLFIAAALWAAATSACFAEPVGKKSDAGGADIAAPKVVPPVIGTNREESDPGIPEVDEEYLRAQGQDTAHDLAPAGVNQETREEAAPRLNRKSPGLHPIRPCKSTTLCDIAETFIGPYPEDLACAIISPGGQVTNQFRVLKDYTWGPVSVKKGDKLICGPNFYWIDKKDKQGKLL